MIFTKIIVKELQSMENKNPTQGGHPILKREQLHHYQERGVNHIIDNHKSALFLEMGL